MKNFFAAALLAPLACLLFACGSDTGSGGTTGGDIDTCNSCAATEVCVANATKEGSTDRCVAIPAACGTTASCADQACISALYDLCEMGWIGVACSDTHPPTILSCNVSK